MSALSMMRRLGWSAAARGLGRGRAVSSVAVPVQQRHPSAPPRVSTPTRGGEGWAFASAPTPPCARQERRWLNVFHRAAAYATDSEVRRISDRILETMREEASALREHAMTRGIAQDIQGGYETLGEWVGSWLASQLAAHEAEEAMMRETITPVLGEPRVMKGVCADLAKAWVSDPAMETLLQAACFFKGFHATTTHRVAHALWNGGGASNRAAALLLQSRSSRSFGVDIHPAAVLGNGVYFDHATGVVIGATAHVGDNVYMLHGVTLGATGRPTEPGAKRHPTVLRNASLGAGCTILGDVEIGAGATVGAAAVVSRDVPTNGTVVGVNKLLTRTRHVDDNYTDDFTWMYYHSTRHLEGRSENMGWGGMGI